MVSTASSLYRELTYIRIKIDGQPKMCSEKPMGGYRWAISISKKISKFIIFYEFFWVQHKQSFPFKNFVFYVFEFLISFNGSI